MCYANNERQNRTNVGRNIIIKARKSQNAYEFWGILEADTIKQEETKEKLKKEYPRRTRKLFEIKLHSSNLINGINAWAVLLVRYSGPFLKMDQRKTSTNEPENKKTYDHA